MSLLPEVDPPALLPEESRVDAWFVAHTQGNHFIHGELSLTNRRLVFQPQKMGALIGALGVVAGTYAPSGEPWSTYLADITQVTEEPTSKRLTQEGRLVSIARRWGLAPEQFFVVTRLETMAPAVRDAVAKVDAAVDAQRERWTLPANCVQEGTAVGGSLSLVGTSLVFLPSSVEKKLDALVGSALQPLLSLLGRDAPAEAREIALADIARIEKLESELSLESARAGGLLDRLRIVKKDGSEAIFVVGDLDETIERLRRCVA